MHDKPSIHRQFNHNYINYYPPKHNNVATKHHFGSNILI